MANGASCLVSCRRNARQLDLIGPLTAFLLLLHAIASPGLVS